MRFSRDNQKNETSFALAYFESESTSFSHLKGFCFDILKIDGKVICGIEKLQLPSFNAGINFYGVQSGVSAVGESAEIFQLVSG